MFEAKFGGVFIGIIYLARKSESDIFYSLMRCEDTCAYQRMRNITFAGDFAKVLNEMVP